MTASVQNGVRRLVAAVSLNVFGSILTAIAGVGATSLMARKLPVGDFGRILLLLTAVNAIAIFEGLRPVVIHRMAAGRESPHALFLATARINAVMVIITLACLILALLAGVGSDLSVIVDFILCATIIVFFIVMQYWTFLDAEQDTVFTGLSRAGCWTAIYISFIILASFGLDFAWYTFSIFLMHVVLAMILRARLIYQGFMNKYKYGDYDGTVEPLFHQAANNIAFNISAVTINVADRAIVGAIMGAGSAGLYAGPSELALRAVGLIRAGVQVILPWAARLSARDQERYWSLGALLSLIFVGSGCAILLLVRNWVAVLFLGDAFRAAGDLLGLFGLGILSATLGYVCIIQLNARGDFLVQRRLYMAAAVLLIAGSIAGAFSGNLIHVAIAYLAARSVDLVLLALILYRLPTYIQRWFFSIGATLVLALVASWNGLIWLAIFSLLLVWGLSGRFVQTIRGL